MTDSLVTKFGGKTDRLTRELEPGDRLVIVAECAVTEIRDDGETITRGLKMVDVHELDGDLGRSLVQSLRTVRRQVEDAASGRDVLPGLEVTTDVAGVVATAAERAAMRGEPETVTGVEPTWDGDPGTLETEVHGAGGEGPGEGPFDDALGKPYGMATASEIKAALAKTAAAATGEQMVELAGVVERLERARKGGSRKRVLDALAPYTMLPEAPAATEPGPVPSDSDVTPDDGEPVELGDVDGFGIPVAGDFEPTDEPVDDEIDDDEIPLTLEDEGDE